MTPEREQVTALVRAIRRAHVGDQYGGIVSFWVKDVHEFASRLVREGVTVSEATTEQEAV